MPEPIACSLSDPERAKRLAALEREIFSRTISARELPDGYAFVFPGDREWLARLATFIAEERECCPFFRFELAVEGDGPTQLRLTGPEGTKAMIETQFLGQLDR